MTRTGSTETRRQAQSGPGASEPDLPVLGQLPDDELADRMNRGDVVAFDVLYDRHATYVKGVCVHFLRSTEEAEDILQDIFLRLWGGRIRYRPEQARLRTWLFCIAKNRCLDRLKSCSRRFSSDAVPIDLVDPDAPDPEADAQASQDRARVHRALGALPLEQRQAIETCFFRSPTYREAAEILAIPFGTLKSRVRLGLRKLAASLRDEEGLSSVSH